MSTLKTNTLSNAAGTKTVPVDTVVDGSAKAWVNFNGTGTVAIRQAFNVSSITDNGVGDYTVNFTNAMVDANFCVQVTLGATIASTTTLRQLYAGTTTSQRFFNASTGTAAVDIDNLHVAVFR